MSIDPYPAYPLPDPQPCMHPWEEAVHAVFEGVEEAAEAVADAAEAVVEAAEPPQLPTPGDVTRNAIENLQKMREVLLDLVVQAEKRGDQDACKNMRKQLKECERLLSVMEGTLTGALDAAVLLLRQPTAEQLALPGRRGVLLAKAVSKMTKSKLMFPAPGQVLGAVGALLGEERLDDVMELEHRILHFLAECNLIRDGLSASSFLTRLIKAGKGAVTNFGTDANAASLARADADKMRATLLGFLEDARGRPA